MTSGIFDVVVIAGESHAGHAAGMSFACVDVRVMSLPELVELTDPPHGVLW